MIESLLSVVGQRCRCSAFLLAFAYGFDGLVFHDTSHDQPRVCGEIARFPAGACGSGLIFASIALVSLAFLPFKVEYARFTPSCLLHPCCPAT